MSDDIKPKITLGRPLVDAPVNSQPQRKVQGVPSNIPPASTAPAMPVDPQTPPPVGMSSPGVPIGGEPTTALTMQQTRGRGEQAYQQIGSAPSPDVSADNPISKFLTGAQENFSVAAYAAANLATRGGVDAAIDSVMSRADGGKDAAAMTAADRASLGTIDSLAGGKAQLSAMLSGKSQEEAGKVGAAVKDQVNLNLLDTREEYKFSSMGGDVVGTMLSGAPFLKAAQLGFKATSYFLAPAAAAAGEEFTYQLNSDASLSKASVNAGTAAIIGGIGAKVFRGGQQAYGYLFGKGNKLLEQEFGAQLVNSAKLQAARNGQSMTDAEAVKLIQTEGPGQFITDLFPDLQKNLFAMAGSPDVAVQQRARDMLAARSDMQFGYRDDILRAIQGTNPPRSQMAFNSYLDTAQKQLTPRYNQLFDNMDTAKWQLEVPTIRDSITKLIDTTTTTAGDDLSTLMKLTDAAGPRQRLTFREVNELRKKISNEVYQRIRNNNSGANTTSLPITNLKKAQQYLNSVLKRNSEFASLQNKYGDIEESRNAYEFGRKVLTSNMMEGTDAKLFLAGNSSNMVAEALAEGSRYGLYSAARSAANPATAIKEARMDDLSTIIGPEPVAAMKEAIQKIVDIERTTKAVSEGLEAARTGSNPDFMGSRMIDIRTALGGAGGRVGPAERFAIGRIFQSLTGNGKPVQGEMDRAAQVQSKALMERGGAVNPVNQYANSQGRITGPQVAGVGLSGAASNSESMVPEALDGIVAGAGGGAASMLQWMMENQPK